MLKERMDKLGIENVFINGNDGKNKAGDAIGQMLQFFKRHLSVDS